MHYYGVVSKNRRIVSVWTWVFINFLRGYGDVKCPRKSDLLA